MNNLLAGGGFSTVTNDTATPVATIKPLLDTGAVVVAQPNWFVSNWGWLLLAVVVIGVVVFFVRKGMMKK